MKQQRPSYSSYQDANVQCCSHFGSRCDCQAPCQIEPGPGTLIRTAVRPKKPVCSRCNNLIQNPSFEEGLTGWVTDNVITANDEPFEGNQVARLGQGVASMFQDVAINSLGYAPLFLSFVVFPGSESNNNGNLTVEVLWLNADRNIIATGQSVFIPDGRINTFARITYFDITDRPPAGADWARVLFSKGAGVETDLIEIDLVILTTVSSINLVQNSNFEAGLTAWTSVPGTAFVPDFATVYEGNAVALNQGNDGTLFQDVPINNLPAHSSFLLSFAINAGLSSTNSVQVLWLDSQNNQIGTPGLNLIIPSLTLSVQLNYLTYVDVTGPAPTGAVKARIQFVSDAGVQTGVRIDKTILARTYTTNLVQNPSFENGLIGWTTVNTTAAASNQAYEGNNVAQMGESGGVLFQDVPIRNAPGRCFLFNCGVGCGGGIFPDGNILIKILWLDANGREIGLGLSLVDPLSNLLGSQWLIYTGITEPAPPGTAAARILFTKSEGATGGTIDIDKVVLARLV